MGETYFQKKTLIRHEIDFRLQQSSKILFENIQILQTL